ncbi:MAG: hypothetical protein FWG87_05585 [Defluviitaleaceae bacterium]|nr:hypothetical protein [Defluviitaleaceae bacterium]
MNLKKFTDTSLTNLSRAADMLCLCIGDPRTIEIKSPKGTITKKVSDYAIHFQCQWRFVKGSQILLASHDIYNPYDESLVHENWDWDICGREKEQSSVFDVRSKELINEFPLKIRNIYYADTCDLHIDFDKAIYFETFISDSTKREFYRAIDNITREHTVVFDVDYSGEVGFYE